MKNIKSSKRREMIKHIHQGSIYVSHLLRHHLKSEGDYLCKAIDQDLPYQKNAKRSPLRWVRLGNRSGIRKKEDNSVASRKRRN